jgi:hypothetical protein
MGVITEFCGPAAVPVLLEEIVRDVRISAQDLPVKAAAMDSFRSLDDDAIAVADTAEVLAAVIDLVEVEFVEAASTRKAPRRRPGAC